MAEPSGRSLLLQAARGEATPRPPVWLMRQAGRYLPEYRELRSNHSFLEAVTTPSIAARVSRMPYERFRPDGVICYSDLLTVVEPLGFSYRIESGVGPVVDEPIETPADVPTDHDDVRETLAYLGETVGRLDSTTGDAGVIGFAGGPFTVATYLLDDGASRSKMTLRRFRAQHPAAFRRLLGVTADVVAESLALQADRGADLVQLFDTRAAFLSPADYREFLLPLHQRILAAVDVPTVLFVRTPGGHLDALAEAGADVLALDWTVSIARARERLGDHPIQGNLDPSLLYAEPAVIERRTRQLIEQAGPAGHILNLGHGVHKHTPLDGVRRFVRTAKRWSWE